jgi:hypothetical protein
MAREGGSFGEGSSIGDDGGYDDVSAFVYLKLYEDDEGDLTGRTTFKEYVDREPWCVDLNKYGAKLRITNSGKVASDLVTVEWRMAFCTASFHKPQDGFTASHALETGSSELDAFVNVDFLLPGETKDIDIPFPEAPSELVNIYFQARVSTLWTGSIPMDQWDFAKDVAVTEAHAPA